ncbi:MAG TPA: FAD-binding oxidoreductase [Gemmatimonadales bacterium]|nr:FAD-binding oxidoreductase [Gemmatimonadales bacterium]
MLERPVEQACFWLAQRKPSQVTVQQGSDEATVVVVGGGLTGLWTALYLRELDPSAQVVVLEQELVAYGASGRNAGMLSETVDHSHSLAVAHFGAREAALLARIGEANVAELIEFLRSRGLNCDFEPTGRIVMALTPAQVEDARKSVQSADELGIQSFRFIDREEAQGELHSPLYQGGVAVSGGGILDPVKLVDALRREAERLGVRVYEKSPVRSFHSNGTGVVIGTASGTLRARKVVLATSAYTHQLLPKITRRFIPLYDYVLVSAPLTASQWETLGWKRRQGITDGRTFFNYYRPTADGRVLWGTSEATYYSGNVVGPSCDHSARHYQSLIDSWKRHFPALGDLEWEYAWGGAICSTTRMTPFFGSAEGGRVHYGLGYTGHGLGTTRLAGRILAHQALDRPSELLDLSLVKKKPFPYPPEPMRSWAVKAVTRGLRRVDAGEAPNLLLRLLEKMGIGFSS